MFNYDVAVIGAGAAGMVASKVAAGFGRKTILIEKKRIGGDCTIGGCVPSKALIKTANTAKDIKRLREFGLEAAADIKLEYGKIMEHVRAVVRDIESGHSAGSFEKEGIDVVFGSGQFLDRHRFEVDGKIIKARKFIICTGSHPFIPPVEGLDKVPYLTSKTIFDLDQLPESMIILGGGPVGSEICSAMVKLGVKVTVVEKARHILVREDSEVANRLMGYLESEGVKFITKNEIISIHLEHGMLFAKLMDITGRKSEIQAKSLLIAVGRRPNLEGFGLKNTGVQYDRKGIKVDKHLRTSAKNIYAAGDVVPPYMFSHISEYEAVVAATNACLPISLKRAYYNNVPWCTFTDPELGRLGLTEQEAKSKCGDKIKVYRWENSKVDRCRTDLATSGFCKIVCGKKRQILGVHILGRCASEILHELQLARYARIPFGKIGTVIHAYPSYSDSIRQPAKKCYVDTLRSNIFVKAAAILLSRQNQRRILLLIIAAALFTALWFSGLRQELALENIQDKGEYLKSLTEQWYLPGVLGYIGLYMLVIAFSIPGAAVLSIVSGYLYNFVIGALYANIGATAGSVLAFLFARYIAGEALQEKYTDRLAKFNEDFEKNGTGYLLAARLIFVLPLFLVNLPAGLTKVRLWTFIWTTSAGLLPASLIYAYAGQELGKIQKVSEIFSGHVLAAFGLLAALAIAPVIIRKIRKHSSK